MPELPRLEPGLTMLEADTKGALQSLVIDHLCGCGIESEAQRGAGRNRNRGRPSALWIDSRDIATTGDLARLAPSPRILHRIDVARAFTPYQHYRLVDSLADELEARADTTVELVVVPEIDWFYGADDLHGGAGLELLTASLDRLEGVASRFDLSVLLTRSRGAPFRGVLESSVETTIACQQTRFGPRFTGDDFETLVYPTVGGVQTTLAFWQEVLQVRHHTQPALHTEVIAHGTN